MVVALCSPIADGPLRAELADVLGADPASAAKFAAGLLVDPHPIVATGAGLWVRPSSETTAVETWRAALPDVVDTGDIPDQEALDAWATERTAGLIERFPIQVDDDVLCLLATALATKVSWRVPFTVVDAAALGSSPWATRLRQVLQAPRGDPRHRQYIADTQRAGTVAVHLAEARGGLLVGSVIATDPEAPAGDVLAAAEEIVTTEATGTSPVDRSSLFDLPLGARSVWTIDEVPVETAASNSREELVESVLPAWSAETDVDLDSDALGFPAAAKVIASALTAEATPYEARQRAMASYSAVGFEAAAVTGLAHRLSRTRTRPGLRRVATVRFGHRFAVVAAAYDDPHTMDAGLSRSPWHGLPVFSAWITEPTDAEPA